MINTEIKKSNTKQVIKKIFQSFIRSNGKGNLVYVIIFGIFVSFLGTLEPLFFAEIIKKLEVFYKTSQFDIKNLIILIIYWSLFIIFDIFISYYYFYHLVKKKINKEFMESTSIYSKKLIKMTTSEYLSKKTGSIYKVFDRGVNNQFEFLYFFFHDFLKTFVSIITVIIIVFLVNPLMAFLALVAVPIMVGFGLYFYKIIGPTQNELNDKWDDVFGDFGNIMSNFFLVKSLTLEKYFTKRIDNTLDNLYKKQLKVEKSWSIAEIYTSTLVMFSRLLVLGFGVYFITQHTLSLSTLILVFSYIGRVYFPLGFMFGKLRNIQIQLTAVEKFYEEFGNNLDQEVETGEILEKIKGSIEFKNVCFGYSKDRDIIKDLNFKINKGEKIAIVGNTGAGKSTLINLILKFYNTKKGEILIDGKNIAEINNNSLRKHIGIVSQDNSLFNLSILENLTFAKHDATEEEINEALKSANAEFVLKLKNGIETIIGERGLKLSGGERQRISIARLFLKNPEILILDEATSALDNKTEKVVHKSLDKLLKGRTSIIIAHRLSTIKNADKILVLENGKIVETGNYEELVEKKGKFFELANPDKLMIS